MPFILTDGDGYYTSTSSIALNEQQQQQCLDFHNDNDSVVPGKKGMNEYHTTKTRRRRGLDDTTVPNKKMKSGESGSSGSSGNDESQTLVELQLELAGSNKLLLEEKERSKQLERSKLFLL